MNSQHTHSIGDRVIVDPAVARSSHLGVVYRVTRLLPVNVVVEPVDGGRTMKINPGFLQPAPATEADTIESTSSGNASAGAATSASFQPPLEQGTVVTVAGPGWTRPADQLYVVLRDSGGRVSVTRLGGDNGRYWRVNRRLLTVIDPARVRLAPDGAS